MHMLESRISYGETTSEAAISVIHTFTTFKRTPKQSIVSHTADERREDSLIPTINKPAYTRVATFMGLGVNGIKLITTFSSTI